MENYKDFFTPVAILIAGVMISGSIVVTNGVLTMPKEGLTGQVAAQPNNSQLGDEEIGPKPEVAQEDHIRGNSSAPITIIEYSDFQCPFCRQFHPTMQQVLAEYGDHVKWVYKHFPLDQIHPQARPAAEASECVAEQGGDEAFWGFADALFANQNKLGTQFYEELVWEMDLNIEQFRNCVSQQKYKEKVEAQREEGMRLGVNGTPGSFVNSIPVRGALPYENLKVIIDDELGKLGITPEIKGK